MFLEGVLDMKIIKNLIVNIVVSAILLFVFNKFQLGIEIKVLQTFSGNEIIGLVGIFLILWLIFRIFNSPIKRILKTLSLPINALTLWLFSIVINVLVFYLFAYFTNNFFDWDVVVRLWQIRQTLILSFIMAAWTYILKKIL